jgi:2'-5' RNA ligase
MTANELADKCNRLQGEIILGFLADCATMLRQQAKEIEALKKDLALKTRDRDVFANFTLAYEKRIEELEKGSGWLEETDEQVIANAEKRFSFLKKASEK